MNEDLRTKQSNINNDIRKSVQNQLKTIRISENLDSKITLNDFEDIADRLNSQDKDISLNIIKKDSTNREQEKDRKIELEI